jgi:hypothetical protein
VRGVVLALVLASCGTTRDGFLVELARVRCSDACAAGTLHDPGEDTLQVYSESAEECRAAVRDDGRSATADCRFRKGRSAECLDEVADTCELATDGACAAVFSCDDWVEQMR